MNASTSNSSLPTNNTKLSQASTTFPASPPPILLLGITVVHSFLLDGLADFVGWIYFLAWCLQFYPQAYLVWRTNDADGFSYDMVLLQNTASPALCLQNFLLYYVPELQREYETLHPHKPLPVKPNDLASNLHSVIASLLWVVLVLRAHFTKRRREQRERRVETEGRLEEEGQRGGDEWGQSESPPEEEEEEEQANEETLLLGDPPAVRVVSRNDHRRENTGKTPAKKGGFAPRVTIVGYSFFFGSLAALGMGIMLSLGEILSWLNTVYLLGAIKVILNVIKYAPQVWVNFRLKTASGMAVGMILCDLVGATCLLLQMVFIAINNDDGASITGNPGKFGAGAIVFLYSLIFLIQKYVIYGEWRKGSGGRREREGGYEEI